MHFPLRHALVITCALAGTARLAGSATAAQPAPEISSDSRATDARAIRAHIDSIFKAYVQKDRATIIATHAKDWRGFLTSSRGIIRGFDDYMAEAVKDLTSDWRMTGYRFVDYDTVFRGEIAIVNYMPTSTGSGADSL
jgi:hypothetical protein